MLSQAGPPTSGQGNRGGNQGVAYYSGGGGGAGAAGADGNSTPHGGAGILNSILGVEYYWAGGGGGSAYSGSIGGNGGIGGGGGGGVGYTTGGGSALNSGDSGGGGRPGTQTNTHGGHGGKNTGGGGGGGAHYYTNNHGGNGGSGIVIIRYLKTLGRSTFNNGSSRQRSSLVFSFDPANKKSSAVEVLVVAGGGGGGMDMGGGGGAGGVVYRSAHSVQTGTPISVTVGAGGAGAPNQYAANPIAGSLGSNSVFDGLVAYGGGGGGSGHREPPWGGETGRVGGCGGGDSARYNNYASLTDGYNRSQFDTSQGYDGGRGSPANAYKAGGGGGAAQSGGGGGNTYPGNGGQGFLSAINGTSLYWAGGGGGANHTGTAGNGGLGGGGGGSAYVGYAGGTGGAGLNSGSNGTAAVSAIGGAGGANTGGGGGGASHSSGVGGAGGSGIVIVRYYGSQKATGGTITSSGGYTVHTFTTSGTFTPTEVIGAKDLSERNNNVIIGGPTYSSDGGGSYSFDGTNDYISFPLPITSNQAYSIIQWVRPSVALTQTRSNLLVGPGPQWSPGYWVNSSTFRVHAFTEYRDITIDWTNDTSWHQVGQIFDGTTCYHILDGEILLGTRTAYSPGFQTTLLLGAENTTGSAYNWNGKIAKTKIYNRVLSAEEVKQNFNAPRGRYGI